MNMKINIAGVEWKNPVTVASGTFGSGEEFSEFVDLNQLGAVTTKGVANVPWAGNPTPRVAEVYGGMMNAIGLQNPGIDVFCRRDIPFLKQFDTKIIVNVCGHAPEEYLAVVERLADEPIDMMEINISCPNVNAGFLAFGQDAKHVEELTAQIKKIAKQPVIMKLTPNVTDITEIARAAEAGGADAVSLINTLTGMKIDIHRRTFALANKTGGCPARQCILWPCGWSIRRRRRSRSRSSEWAAFPQQKTPLKCFWQEPRLWRWEQPTSTILPRRRMLWMELRLI